MAGILPGILIALFFILAIYFSCKLNPSLGSPGPKASWKERIAVFGRAWGVIIIFLLVIGGIYTGLFTSTEAGAVGAFGTLLLGLARRKINWKNFKASITEAGQLTGMLFILIIGANVFNYFIAITEIPFTLAQTISSLSLPPMIILAALLLMYVIIGFFMDIMAVIIITVPIIYPILSTLGIDPIWFGVLAILTIMIGNITPPIGIVVFTVSGMVREVPLFTIFRGVWPFVFAMVGALIILAAFPQISLLIPNLMKPG